MSQSAPPVCALTPDSASTRLHCSRRACRCTRRRLNRRDSSLHSVLVLLRSALTAILLACSDGAARSSAYAVGTRAIHSFSRRGAPAARPVIQADCSGRCSGGPGFVSKDTVAGGYGSRLRPFSRKSQAWSRRRSAASHCQRAPRLPPRSPGARAVVGSTGALTTTSRSSVVSRRLPTRNGLGARDAGVAFAGIVGLARSLSAVRGRRRLHHRRRAGSALMRFRRGPSPASCRAQQLRLVARRSMRVPFSGRPIGGSLPVMASRSCGFCAAVASDQASYALGRPSSTSCNTCRTLAGVCVVFRDPLFTQDRERVPLVTAFAARASTRSNARHDSIDLTTRCSRRCTAQACGR